ncbi:hypothetical protein Btru_078007 [Bulinus truncatus]|nr:hypothetical protein Btru_078007 [Bulinus truncatus]
MTDNSNYYWIGLTSPPLFLTAISLKWTQWLHKLEQAPFELSSTPVSTKSGISSRLSPLPLEKEKTFVTFRWRVPKFL